MGLREAMIFILFFHLLTWFWGKLYNLGKFVSPPVVVYPHVDYLVHMKENRCKCSVKHSVSKILLLYPQTYADRKKKYVVSNNTICWGDVSWSCFFFLMKSYYCFKNCECTENCFLQGRDTFVLRLLSLLEKTPCSWIGSQHSEWDGQFQLGQGNKEESPKVDWINVSFFHNPLTL